MNTESICDWEISAWSVPLVFQAAQQFELGLQILQLMVSGKYWAEVPDDGPEGWGWRLQLTLLYPT